MTRTLIALLLPAVIFGCGKDGTSDDDTVVDETEPTETDSDTDADSDSDSDSDSDTDTETGDDTDTTVTNPDHGVVAVDITEEGFEDVEYELVTFEVTDKAPEPYDSLFEGHQPTFYVWRPKVDPGVPIPLLAWFHGGAIGDDTAAAEGGDFPQPCSEEQILDAVHTNIGGPSMAPKLAARRGWAMVLIRNDWCDAWQGRGPDDAVDPDRHYGYYHAERTLDWLREGHAGFDVDDDAIYSWGTSAGSTAAVIAAHRYPEIDGVAFDSGISSFINYYERAGLDYGTGTGEMVHIFGGDPYTKEGEPNGDVWQRYQDASPSYQIAELALRVPLFIAWNTQDQNVGTSHGEDLIAAAAGAYSGGDRWYAKNLDHLYPSPRGHVQTIYGFPPLGYLPYTIMEFLEGANVVIQEAEDGCATGCTVGASVISLEDASLEGYSEAGARIGIVGDAGVLLNTRLPTEVAAGADLRIGVAMKGSGHDILVPSEPIATVQYLEGGTVIGEKVFVAGDLAPASGSSDARVIDQLENSWMSVTTGDISNAEVRFLTEGVAELRLDTLLFLY